MRLYIVVFSEIKRKPPGLFPVKADRFPKLGYNGSQFLPFHGAFLIHRPLFQKEIHMIPLRLFLATLSAATLLWSTLPDTATAHEGGGGREDSKPYKKPKAPRAPKPVLKTPIQKEIEAGLPSQRRDHKKIITQQMRSDIQIISNLFEDVWDPVTGKSLQPRSRIGQPIYTVLTWTAANQSGTMRFLRSGDAIMTIGARTFRGTWAVRRGVLTVTLPPIDGGRPRSDRVIAEGIAYPNDPNRPSEVHYRWGGFTFTAHQTMVRGEVPHKSR